MSAPDLSWGAGQGNNCAALIDGTVAWGTASGRHINADSSGHKWVRLSWASPQVVSSLHIYQYSAGYQHGDFVLQTLDANDASTWRTVATYGSSPSESSYTSSGDVSYTLPAPVITTAVRFLGTYANDVYRFEEFRVNGCAFSCPSTHISRTATCTMSAPDPAWGAGQGNNCAALIDGTVAWGTASGRHINADSSGHKWVRLSWASPQVVSSLHIYQYSAGYQHGDFVLQTLDANDASTWRTVATYGSSPSESSYTSSGDVSYTLPAPVITTAVRFLGTYANDVYRFEEFRVNGCPVY